jgi:hypothetical protein
MEHSHWEATDFPRFYGTRTFIATDTKPYPEPHESIQYRYTLLL